MTNLIPIYFDIETTGLNIREDKIIEIAACSNKKNFSSLVNPLVKIPKESQEIHGISNEMVQSAPTFEEVSKNFINFCNECGETPVLIAHNGDYFDFPFLRNELQLIETHLPQNWLFLDSIIWAKQFRSDLGKYSLQFLREYFDIPSNTAHRALDDALVLKEVFECLIGDLDLMQVIKILSSHQEQKSCDVMPFGKHQGKELKDLPSGYVKWLFGSGALDKSENISLRKNLEKIHSKIYESAVRKM